MSTEIYISMLFAERVGLHQNIHC